MRRIIKTFAAMAVWGAAVLSSAVLGTAVLGTGTAVLGIAGLAAPAHAGFIGLPQMLGTQARKIAFSGPTLAPFAHTLFCMQYPWDCAPSYNRFRPGPIALDDTRWNELRDVNGEVNRSIRFERNLGGIAAERWLISPGSGDCNDYAVTKRHELIARGWATNHHTD